MELGLRCGILAARFQPYHNGHHALVRRYLESRSESLILAVVVSNVPVLEQGGDHLAAASAEHHAPERNPLSTWARIEMLHDLWRTEISDGRLRVQAIPRPQGPDSWWRFVTSFLPEERFWIIKWMQDGFEQEKAAFFRDMGEQTLRLDVPEDTRAMRGRELRAMLARGESLDGYVPTNIANALVEASGRWRNEHSE